MSFKDRERDFENRFVHDQELKFRITARADKLLGLWAAEQLGRNGQEAQAYAQEIIRVDFERPNGQGAVERVCHDLSAAGADISDEAVRARMGQFLAEAERQVMAE